MVKINSQIIKKNNKIMQKIVRVISTNDINDLNDELKNEFIVISTTPVIDLDNGLTKGYDYLIEKKGH